MAIRAEIRRYKGLTKRLYKKRHGSSTPGSTKGATCRATGLDKAMAIYPRSYRTDPMHYIQFNKRKDKAAGRSTGFFSDL